MYIHVCIERLCEMLILQVENYGHYMVILVNIVNCDTVKRDKVGKNTQRSG